MADEARVTCSLQIKKGNLDYQSRPTSFQADVTGSKGPTPGALAATTAGINISLAELTYPGFCKISNLDDTNYVMVGIHDGAVFYPLMELQAGEFAVFRLSRDLGEELTGTGTPGASAGNRLHIKADTAPCAVVVEAFER